MADSDLAVLGSAVLGLAVFGLVAGFEAPEAGFCVFGVVFADPDLLLVTAALDVPMLAADGFEAEDFEADDLARAFGFGLGAAVLATTSVETDSANAALSLPRGCAAACGVETGA